MISSHPAHRTSNKPLDSCVGQLNLNWGIYIDPPQTNHNLSMDHKTKTQKEIVSKTEIENKRIDFDEVSSM